MTSTLWLIVLAGALSIVYGIVTTRGLLAADAGTAIASNDDAGGFAKIVELERRVLMRAALDDRPWSTRAVTTGELVDTYKARDLLREISEAAHVCVEKMVVNGVCESDWPQVAGLARQFPDLIVPAGFSDDRLPIGISFLGTAWSEPRLIALVYSFEQITRARRRPITTPALPGEAVVLR